MGVGKLVSKVVRTPNSSSSELSTGLWVQEITRVVDILF
jgi:hypothetical protein